MSTMAPTHTIHLAIWLQRACAPVTSSCTRTDIHYTGNQCSNRASDGSKAHPCVCIRDASAVCCYLESHVLGHDTRCTSHPA